MPAGVANYQTTGSESILLNDCTMAPGIMWAIEVREEETAGGIILPDVLDAQKMRVAYCVKCGPGVPDEQGNEKFRFIREGDYFIFGKYQSGGEPLKLNGFEILQFRQGDQSARLSRVSASKAAYVAKAVALLNGVALELVEQKAAA